MKLTFVLAVLGVFVLCPLLGIWALNTLFPIVSIPYTLKTWAAALVLIGLLSVKSS